MGGCGGVVIARLRSRSQLFTAAGRPTNGGITPIPCCKLRSPCVPVGGAGSTLLGVLKSMPKLTVVGIEAVA